VLGQIFKLRKLRRQSGLGKVTQDVSTVPEQYYSREDGSLTPFPVSLAVQVCLCLQICCVGKVGLRKHTSSMSESGASGNWGLIETVRYSFHGRKNVVLGISINMICNS
jgi:hypothetical protein